MEQKKQLLIKVIEKIKPYRNKSEEVLDLLNNWNYNENLIDEIIKRLSKAIKKCRKQGEMNSLRKWLEAVKKIRELEEQDKISDEELDSQLDALLELI